jgi:hypothetical protein
MVYLSTSRGEYMLNVTLKSVKPKEAYDLFFDQTFLEAGIAKKSFANPNPLSKFKLGDLGGLMLYTVPAKMIVLAVAVTGGRDVIAVVNFFPSGSDTKIVINAVNIPSSAAGDKIVASLESIIGAYKARFPK